LLIFDLLIFALAALKMDKLSKLIKTYLDENQIEYFQVNDIRKYFGGFQKKEFEYALKKIIDFEFTKIEDGKYCKNTFRNEYVIGNVLTGDGVIAYWSALNIHGLTEQFPNKVFVQTIKKKENKDVFGVHYQFVKVRPRKFIGTSIQGVGSNQFKITDIEKTIVDCFDLVQYSGGFMELIRAFKNTKLKTTKLIDYCLAIGNKAAIKRMGFLAELFEKEGMKQFIEFAKKSKSKNYDLFDVYGSDKGRHLAEWNLKLNISEKEIADIANSIY
jgi:predicted transcriptional regulator of viral defense system